MKVKHYVLTVLPVFFHLTFNLLYKYALTIILNIFYVFFVWVNKKIISVHRLLIGFHTTCPFVPSVSSFDFKTNNKIKPIIKNHILINQW